MGKSGHALRRVEHVDARTLAERISSFLRLRHPAKTAAHVEAETGIPSATVRKWLEQGNAPSGAHYDALVVVYGAPMLCAVRPHDRDAWWHRAARAEHQAALEARAEAIKAQLAHLRGRR